MAQTRTATTRLPPAVDDNNAAGEHTATAPASVQALPPDFSFTVSRNLPIPVKVRATPTTAHAFVSHFDEMGHNDSIFVPLAYWLARGRTVENTPPAWQRATISGLHVAWRKKDPEARGKYRLTTVAREVGEDPEFPQFAGVRAWMVDTTR